MVVTQPQNKDTAPGLLLPLLHVYKRFPEAPVAVFPSDHFILEEDVFIQHVDRAFRLVESDRSRIALLGIEPTDPDPEYGYIVPGETVDDPEHHGARKVEMFVEKPSREAAKKIIRRDALVNTLVVVFSCNTLMDAIKHTVPELHRSFQSILEAIGTAEEDRVIDKVYQKLPSVNFCKDVVENLSVERRQALVVLPVQGVTWSDWGVSERLSSILRQLRDSDHLQPKPAISPPSKLSPRKNVLVMPPKRIQ
jgi:mannose-1-phosphate guanylyltransferase